MKVEFEDAEHGTSIVILPETIEEAAQLMRFSANARREPADIYLSYYNKVYCSIWMRKRKDKVSSINNKN
jgi:hypothetical protein